VLAVNQVVLWHCRGRPLNSHGATVRLRVSAVISRSHGGGFIGQIDV